MLSSEEVEEETEHQGSKVSNASPFTHKSLVTTHQDVTCASFSPTMQVPSEPAGEGSGPPREPDSAAVKSECKVSSGGQRFIVRTYLADVWSSGLYLCSHYPTHYLVLLNVWTWLVVLMSIWAL